MILFLYDTAKLRKKKTMREEYTVINVLLNIKKKGLCQLRLTNRPVRGKADAVTHCPADGRLPGQGGVETRPWRSQCSWE